MMYQPEMIEIETMFSLMSRKKKRRTLPLPELNQMILKETPGFPKKNPPDLESLKTKVSVYL